MPLDGGTAASPHLRRRQGRLRRLDAGRQAPRRHRRRRHACRHSSSSRLDLADQRRLPRRARACRSPRPPTAPTTEPGKTLVLHPPAVPGQPHQALPGRHRPEPVEVRRRRRRGDAAHRRLHGHQQEPRVVAGPRLLPHRPRRHHERLVDEARRRRPRTSTRSTTAGTPHPWPPDDGRIVYQLGADIHLSTSQSGRTERRADRRSSSDFDQTREHVVAKPLDYLTAAHLSPNGDKRRADGPRPRVRRPGQAERPVRRGPAQAGRPLPRRPLPRRQDAVDARPTSRARSNSGRCRPTASASRRAPDHRRRGAPLGGRARRRTASSSPTTTRTSGCS